MTMEFGINEIFYSIQGEGFHAGRSALFIRFAGCNLNCDFCDTDFSEAVRLSAEGIIEMGRAALGERGAGRPSIIVLTGGEPALQATGPLLTLLRKRLCPYIAIETNGTVPIKCAPDWITLSPKSEDGLVLTTCDELKVVYPAGVDPLAFERFGTGKRYIQPLWVADRYIREVYLRDAINFVLENYRWKLSIQTHKLIGVK